MSDLQLLCRENIDESRHSQTRAPPRVVRFLRRFLRRLDAGQLTVVMPSGQSLTVAGKIPGLQASVNLKRWRALRRLSLGGDVGFAESFVEGDWTTPNLAALLRLAASNIRRLDSAIAGSTLMRMVARLRQFLRANTRRGSRRNIVAHYDLGNVFYRLWLDGAMQYSSGIFEREDETLEAAQARKLARIADLLRLEGGESVLEIGCGWGGLAQSLAEKAGAKVTALTVSPAQQNWACDLVRAAGLEGRIEVRLQDYRDVSGAFDRIVSIEMLEAVGESWWPTYFRGLADRLKPGGRAVLQVITIADDRYEAYRRAPDFIQKHIFPGGFLPSPSALVAQVAAAGLRIAQTETFGPSYAQTLAHWRARFDASWPQIAAQGFDERFRRLWTYYFCYCEAGFAEGLINVGLYVVERDEAA